MVRRETVLKELDVLTDQLSTQVRTTAFAALVFAWGLLVGDSAVARSIAGQLEWHLVAVGAMAVLTMFLDFAQTSRATQMCSVSIGRWRQLKRKRVNTIYAAAHSGLDWLSSTSR
jgi:hypothetical protein